MRHRRNSLALLIAVVGIAACASHVAAAPSQDRPNILWLSCEDIGPLLGCYGRELATTPNLDRFASRGVRFTNATVTAGVCAPCRSAIITGVYQTTLGTHHMRCRAKLPDGVRPFTTYLRKAGYYCTNNSKEDYQFHTPPETWDASSGKAHYKNRPRKDQPFFAVFNYTGCHESGIASTGKYQRVTRGVKKHDREAVAKTLPPYYPDTPVTREDWGRYYDVVAALDRWVGGKLKELADAGLAEKTIVFFWSDHGVGLPRAKRWVYDSGMVVPLIVHVPPTYRTLAGVGSDGTDERLVSLMDLGPTVLNLAGLEVPKVMQGQPFLGPNLPAPRSYVYAARDRMDERYDIIRAVRDQRYKYIRNYEPWKTYYQYMNTAEKGATMRELRTMHEQGKLPAPAERYFAPSKPTEELYDLEADPHELNNLADSAEHRDVLERMRQAHLDWVLETRDVGMIPEPEIIRRERRLGSRYAILRQPGAEGLVRRIRDTASLTLEGPEVLPKLVAALTDKDAAVRYWAVIGIGNLAPKDAGIAARMTAMLKDDSPSVRIAAARALARMGKPDPALPVLVAALREGSQWVRVNAAIVLDEMDEQARPVLGAMKDALVPRKELFANGKYTVRVINRALNELLGTTNVVR